MDADKTASVTLQNTPCPGGVPFIRRLSDVTWRVGLDVPGGVGQVGEQVAFAFQMRR